MTPDRTDQIVDDAQTAIRIHDGVLALKAEVGRLRKALAEIVIRTMPYQDDHEGWPLVAGVHRVAHDALDDSV